MVHARLIPFSFFVLGCAGDPVASMMDGGPPSDVRAVDVVMEAAPTCNACPDACYKNACARRVFASSKTYDGVGIQSTSHADDECVAMAKAANLAGSWRAWISDEKGSSPSTRFTPYSGAYILAKATTIRVAKGASDLASTLEHPIDHDELGMLVGGFVWTQTDGAGKGIPSSPMAGNACVDWTSATPTDKAMVGQIGGEWTAATTRSCDQLSRLYCFEQ